MLLTEAALEAKCECVDGWQADAYLLARPTSLRFEAMQLRQGTCLWVALGTHVAFGQGPFMSPSPPPPPAAYGAPSNGYAASPYFAPVDPSPTQPVVPPPVIPQVTTLPPAPVVPAPLVVPAPPVLPAPVVPTPPVPPPPSGLDNVDLATQPTTPQQATPTMPTMPPPPMTPSQPGGAEPGNGKPHSSGMQPLTGVPRELPGWPPTPVLPEVGGGAGPQLKPRGILTMRSLKVASTDTEGAKIFLGSQSEFSLGLDSAANFVIKQESQTTPLLALDSTNTLRLGSQNVMAMSVDAVGGVSIKGVKQWQLVHSEDFTTEATGWTRNQVTQCGGVFMLGGYCMFSQGDVSKTFAGLPPHQQLRVVATYHFIDKWIGEAGYLKLNIGQGGAPVVVWSEQHSEQMSKNGISICGQSQTPEGKFSVSIDVTVQHHLSDVQLAFGSTMDSSDPCDESWGISGIELYTRS